jgi:thiaminase
VSAGTVAAELLTGSGAPWSQLSGHPFIAAAGGGSLGRATFDRWLVADHYFVVGFRRFLSGLVTLAPDEHAADVLAAGLTALQAELDLFRRQAATRGLDLDAEPGPIALGYTAFLRASLQDGYPVALAVLYGAEKAYFDAWSAVRATASRDSAYWAFVDNWSSPSFAGWVAEIAGLLDAISAGGPTPAMRQAFDRVVRFEVRFWSAVHTGDTW